jgi:hypothetical protein
MRSNVRTTADGERKRASGYFPVEGIWPQTIGPYKILGSFTQTYIKTTINFDTSIPISVLACVSASMKSGSHPTDFH